MIGREKPPLPLKREFLAHYGMPRRSGRYPWGSGEDPYQHSEDFASRAQAFKKQGMTEKEIAEAMGCRNTSDYRVKYSQCINDRRALVVAKAKALSEDGLSPTEIGKIMGKNESTIRGYLDSEAERRTNQARSTADFLRSKIEEKGMIDVGDGVERELGISKEKLNQALEILKDEGYPVYGAGVPQATNPGQQTNIKVLCPMGTQHKDIYNYDQINSITDYKCRQDENGNDIYEKGFEYPKSMDSSRLAIRYSEEGGVQKDGVVEIRRGVQDLDLGGSHYAQVRILVDGDHYIKGMAVYSDDLPPGKDILFNTNKKEGTPMMDVLKPIDTKDPNNPFGSAIKDISEGGQYHYIDKNGERQLGLINKRADEGDWGDWSSKVPSQFLSKQSQQLIDKQLNLSIKDRELEFADINSLTNPTVKKQQLEAFAEDCDSAAVHLKAAAFPRQSYQVILPLTSIKDTEVYAPNYKDGETVALIRYPHGGTFEIPILKVNNKNVEGKDIITPNAKDAVGINKKVADRLSGADFDGDTVMVIPCNPIDSRSLARPGDKPSIVSTHPLKDLENFDTKMMYGPAKKEVGADGTERYLDGTGREYKLLSKAATQKEMGVVSNLITDMTLKGATEDELARAVKHSMVVIDAAKHHLDYQKSYEDNGIAALKKDYQGHIGEDGKYHEGASTLISMAKSELAIPKRKGEGYTDPETGKKIYKEAGEYYTDAKGNRVLRMQKSTKMAETDDARTLSSGTLQEEAYARYANKLKEMANQARLISKNTPGQQYEPSAKAAYAAEVARLTSEVNEAMKNAPRERQAQLYAASVRKAIKLSEPGISKKDLKKISDLALRRGREKYGAQRRKIFVSDREWEAIQAGAVTDNILRKILRYSDSDRIKQLATPRASREVTEAKKGKILAMRASGYTNEEIAKAVGLSTKTVSKYANE